MTPEVLKRNTLLSALGRDNLLLAATNWNEVSRMRGSVNDKVMSIERSEKGSECEIGEVYCAGCVSLNLEPAGVLAPACITREVWEELAEVWERWPSPHVFNPTV